MTQQVISVHQTEVAAQSIWKHLWRADAVVNLLIGDLLIFAPGTVIDWMGMEGDTTAYIRAFGVFSVIYALWQFWAARTGRISKTSFLLADVDMTVLGFAAFAVLLMGVQFNDLGKVIVAGGYGIGVWLLAGLWFIASRQVE